jgi:hypothetical protein
MRLTELTPGSTVDQLRAPSKTASHASWSSLADAARTIRQNRPQARYHVMIHGHTELTLCASRTDYEAGEVGAMRSVGCSSSEKAAFGLHQFHSFNQNYGLANYARRLFLVSKHSDDDTSIFNATFCHSCHL